MGKKTNLKQAPSVGLKKESVTDLFVYLYISVKSKIGGWSNITNPKTFYCNVVKIKLTISWEQNSKNKNKKGIELFYFFLEVQMWRAISNFV